MAKIRCVVVTPERTEIDQDVDRLILPMYDGEMGVLPQRAPLVGRLGFGTLTLTNGATVDKFFVDGGFAQVENDVVSVLTSRSIPVSEIDVEAAEKALLASAEMPADTEEQRQLRDAAALRARGQIRSAT